jgi:predicted nucleic acid-binding Zn ribbon protein
VSDPSDRHRAPELSGAFSALIREKGWERKFDQHRVFPVWEELVDKDTAAHSRPLKVVKDVLWVEAENSAWVQQLQFQKIFLLETLNGYLRSSTFSNIRFVVQEKPIEESVEKTTSMQFIPPPPDQVERFKEQISFIEDKDIRESLLRLWYLSQACRRE